MHTHDSVAADLRAVLPFMNDGGHILLHDAFHVGINAAADELVAQHPDITDLGILTRNPTPAGKLCYQGLRLLRVRSSTDRILREAYQRNNIPYPENPAYFHNYDRYAIRMGLVEEREDGFHWVKGKEPASPKPDTQPPDPTHD